MTLQDALKERSKSPDATSVGSVVSAGSQSPGPSVPREAESSPQSPREPVAGSSAQSEPLRVILRHYAWQYEWHLVIFSFSLSFIFSFCFAQTISLFRLRKASIDELDRLCKGIQHLIRMLFRQLHHQIVKYWISYLWLCNTGFIVRVLVFIHIFR